MTTALIIFAFLIVFTFAYAVLRGGAPWVPTRKNDVDRFLKMAQIQGGEVMYDLGCGDGRLVCAAAKDGAMANGVELSLLPYILARFRQLFHQDRSRVKIFYKDIWNVDLSDADIVYIFLVPKVYQKVKEKLEKELKQGAKVITYVWPFEGWEPVAVNTQEGYANMYLYQR